MHVVIASIRLKKHIFAWLTSFLSVPQFNLIHCRKLSHAFQEEETERETNGEWRGDESKRNKKEERRR